MSGWKEFCKMLEDLDDKEAGLDDLKRSAKKDYEVYGVYPGSIQAAGGSYFFIAKDNGNKVLVIYGAGKFYDEFSGCEITIGSNRVKICRMDNYNCAVIRRVFPFTNPVSHRGRDITVGLGDRLGLASAGHIRLIKDKPIFPVLAQQSVRELYLTGRTYHDVLSAASWAVFQEGYDAGFGADGDHLKTDDEVRMALDCGFTMITLDCSEHIDNRAASLAPEEVEREYRSLCKSDIEQIESKYMGKEFVLKSGTKIFFEERELKRTVLIYLKAVKHAARIYNDVIKPYGGKIDFEMSVDETLTPTSPESHFFVASELIAGGVEITSLAPRFCGEFQKGIDYRGDIGQFDGEFTVHAEIASHFGYKISVHSGSDKFSVFPIIGRKTGGKYHLKTAGTNWLEAVRIIALKNPSLYRSMHKYAAANLPEAKKFYHISAQLDKVPDVDRLGDTELPGLMDMDDPRQILHITYGLILQAKNPGGPYAFKDEIYETLNRYEDEYYAALEKHIGRHLKELGAMQ